MRIAPLIGCLLSATALFAAACTPPPPSPHVPSPAQTAPLPARCGGAPMTVRFYDAGQALAVLVELPDNRRLLVDAGESPTRAGCSQCKDWHAHVLDGLTRDLAGARLDLLWITHQHSDHLGGAEAVLNKLVVTTYVDNGRDLDKNLVAAARSAATARGVRVTVIDETQRSVPLTDSPEVRLRAIVPAQWPSSCSSNANDCSIGLRVDYCSSSVLFTGDAEEDLERNLDPGGPVTLLQVGHHGSDTSCTDSLIERTRPRYAVVASAKKDEGTNRTYCHPRLATVERLTRVLGGPATKKVLAFDAAAKCRDARPDDWHEVPTSDHLYFTARDGDVVLVTTGDGQFERAH